MPKINRSRQVHRDQLGYYFDPAAANWRALRPPVVRWGPAPADIAALLGVSAEDDVVIRDRLIGDPSTAAPMQLATSYLPGSLARGTVLEQRDTGPGGIYDRLEDELGQGPLQWREALSTQPATSAEAEALRVDVGAPLLRITRIATSPAGIVVEVNDTRMNGADFEISYDVTRAETAHWPVTPARAGI